MNTWLFGMTHCDVIVNIRATDQIGDIEHIIGSGSSKGNGFVKPRAFWEMCDSLNGNKRVQKNK